MQPNKKAYHSHNAPEPLGAYSQAVSSGSLVYTAGQIGLDPVTGILKKNNIEQEVCCALDNLKAVLVDSGCHFSHVIKTTIYLSNMEDAIEVNSIYQRYFDAPYPARSMVAVSELPKGARFEIEAVAINVSAESTN